MLFFSKRKKTPPQVRPKEPPYIQYSGNTSHKYELTPDELAFLNALEDGLKAAKKSTYCDITRMSTGALSVSSRRAYLGKIKLQGRKTWMQYMTGLYSSETAEDEPLEEYIRLIKYWVKIA